MTRLVQAYPFWLSALALFAITTLAPSDSARALGPEDPGLLHTYLEESEPEDGETVEEEVSQVLFQFNTPVQLDFSQVTIEDADGAEVDHGEPSRAEDRGDDVFQVTFPEPLEPGSYTVSWQTAGPDDHVVRDAFAFSVVDPDADEPPEPTPEPEEVEPVEADVTDPAEDPPGVFIRWLFLIGIVGMIGTVTFRTLILPKLAADEGLTRFGELAGQRVHSVAWVFAILALVALPLRLWVQSASMFGADEALALGNLGSVIFQTSWGTGFLVFLLAILLFGAGLFTSGEGGSRLGGWAVAAVAVLALPLAASLSGHAWGAEGNRPLQVTSLYVHVLAAGVWLGGLSTVLLVGIPALNAAKKERRREGVHGAEEERGVLPGLGRLVGSFSRVALVAVVLLVASGVTQAAALASPLWELPGSEYGRTLLVKVGLAVGAFALGFYNWRVVRPALQERPTPGLLRIPASLEMLLGLGVLLVTAILVVQALP